MKLRNMKIVKNENENMELQKLSIFFRKLIKI